ERRRVSRELHDSVGQLLTALQLAVQQLKQSTAPPAARVSPLADVERLAEELGRTIHDIAYRLRPTILDDAGLHAALVQQLTEWSGRTGIEVDFEADAVQTLRLPPEIETACYRVVQEALTNVVRHAQARKVSVVVSCHGGSATLAIEDDGVGFDPE